MSIVWFDLTKIRRYLLLMAGNLNFKLRIVFLEFFGGGFEKRIALSEIKPALVRYKVLTSELETPKTLMVNSSARHRL